MHRIKTTFASLALLLLVTAAPLTLSACNADSLAGPDQAIENATGNGTGGGTNGGSTGPDRDVRD